MQQHLVTSLLDFILGLFPGTTFVFFAFFSVLQSLATPEAFSRNPSRIWEFYHYRREVMLTKHPNPAHLAIAACEERLGKQGRDITVITQNIDELHHRAGSRNVLEIHGKLEDCGCTAALRQSGGVGLGSKFSFN